MATSYRGYQPLSRPRSAELAKVALIVAESLGILCLVGYLGLHLNHHAALGTACMACGEAKP